MRIVGTGVPVCIMFGFRRDNQKFNQPLRRKFLVLKKKKKKRKNKNFSFETTKLFVFFHHHHQPAHHFSQTPERNLIEFISFFFLFIFAKRSLRGFSYFDYR
jgi:hypothetical protein